MGSGLDAAPFVPRLLHTRPSHAPRRWSAEGTMVLVDISGFTALSEQLARRGREGAEELVTALTRIFTLLMSASDDGGDVIKFAGDALLVLYDGPDHELHACHAARSMQRLLRVVGGVRLAGARARLRMSVGIHTGVFEFLLTGTDQENLVVCGAALDRVLELQDAAQAGETLVSREVAAVLPAGSRAAERELGVLLGRLPAVPSVSSLGRRASAPVDLRRFLPAPFRSRPDLLGADSDHRRAAMAFVQVSGLNAMLGDHRALDRADALTANVERACRDTGVVLLDTDAARDGYRYLLTAGAPLGHEDPEGRLLHALLEITSGGDPALRAGAAAGRVFAGAVGSPVRRTYAVMGDTTNTAARLTSKAGAGQVLAQSTLLARARSAFMTVPHAPLVVKGKADAIPVAVVTATAGPRDRPDIDAFVGRSAELDVLRCALTRAAAGSGGVIEIVGEAGIGKSRLVTEALRTSPLVRRTARAEPYGADVPYRTLTGLLRPVLGLAADDDAEATRARLADVVRERAPSLEPWLALLAPTVGTTAPSSRQVDELEPRFRPARLRTALLALLDALISEPSAFVIEDAQWVDQTSADALAGVFADLSTRPWAVLLTRRDTSEGLRGSEQLATLALHPTPMPAAQARGLVARAAGRSLLPAELDRIVARGDGNPFFLLELASASRTDSVLPDSVEELVGARIDGLDGDERDVLRQAAVLGAQFSADLYAHATGSAALGPDADAAVFAEFLDISADGAVAFRREIYREVAYQQLTFRRRRELHHLAATAIERAPVLAGAARLATLSRHFHAAGAWAHAFRYSRDAAREAQAQYANDEAVVFCRRAVESGRRAGVDAAELRDVHLLLGEMLNLTGRHEEAVQAFRSARRGVREPVQLASLAYKIGMVRREEGRFGAALRAAQSVHELAVALTEHERLNWMAEADLLSAGVRYWQGRSADCRRLTADVVRAVEMLPAGPDRTRLIARAYALHDSAVVELDGRAGDYGEQPLEMFREIGDLYNETRFSVNVAIGYYYEGKWDRAVAMYRRSLELSERTGDVFGVAVAQLNIGELLAYQGKPAAARQLLNESLAALEALNTPLPAAHAACFLGVATRLDGELDEARRCFDESERLFARAGRSAGFSLDELATRRIELLLDQGALERAKDDSRRLLADRADQLAPVHRARARRCLGQALALSGDRDDARQELAESLRICEEIASPYERAITLLAQHAAGLADETAQEIATDLLDGLGVTESARYPGPSRVEPLPHHTGCDRGD